MKTTNSLVPNAVLQSILEALISQSSHDETTASYQRFRSWLEAEARGDQVLIVSEEEHDLLREALGHVLEDKEKAKLAANFPKITDYLEAIAALKAKLEA